MFVYCDDHSSLSSTTAVQYEFHNCIFHINSFSLPFTIPHFFLFFFSFQGISSLVDHPSQASSYLEPLLDFAAQQIPSDKHMETPLYILATAGMRMLSLADQESILDDLRVDIPLKYNFHFFSSHVEVITGKQEGDEICFIFFPLPMIVS